MADSERTSLLALRVKNEINWCSGCIGLLFIGLELCALIIACVDIEPQCHNSLSIQASAALICGVLLNSAFGLIWCIWLRLITDKIGAAVLFGLFIFVVCCYAFSVYYRMDNNCRATPLGQILIAWSIVNISRTFICCAGSICELL